MRRRRRPRLRSAGERRRSGGGARGRRRYWRGAAGGAAGAAGSACRPSHDRRRAAERAARVVLVSSRPRARRDRGHVASMIVQLPDFLTACAMRSSTRPPRPSRWRCTIAAEAHRQGRFWIPDRSRSTCCRPSAARSRVRAPPSGSRKQPADLAAVKAALGAGLHRWRSSRIARGGAVVCARRDSSTADRGPADLPALREAVEWRPRGFWPAAVTHPAAARRHALRDGLLHD